MPKHTCSQKSICALAPATGIFGQTAEDVAAANGNALDKLASAAQQLENKANSNARGACCLDDQCIDNLKKEHCPGSWSAGLACSDAKLHCNVFRIAAHAEHKTTPRKPLPANAGSCCVDGQCTEVPESDCAGAWSLGVSCSSTDCAKTDSIPRGACCNPNRGTCQDGVEETACAAPAKWTKDGKCQAGGVCTGACCSEGTCTQKLKKDCSGEWTLYKDCKLDTCPRPHNFVAIASVQVRDTHTKLSPMYTLLLVF
jgi:hypothetical protein